MLKTEILAQKEEAINVEKQFQGKSLSQKKLEVITAWVEAKSLAAWRSFSYGA